MQSFHAIGPVLAERLAVLADNVVALAPRPGGADLEAGGEDDTVDLVLDAARDDALLRDAFHALGIARVDELDVRAVERRQIVVIEGRPLAELPIPGLERLGRLGVGYGLIDTRANLVHLDEVGKLGLQGLVLRLFFGGVFTQRETDRQVAENLRPAVVHQVDLDRGADDHVVEVLAPASLPAGLEGLYPFRIGGFVAPHIHRRWRTLEDIKLLRVRADVRYGLDRCGAGADQSDTLVGQLCQAAVVVPACIIVIPPAGVEGVAFEALDAGNGRQLRPVERTGARDHEPRPHRVVAVGRDDPAGARLIPAHPGDMGLEGGVFVEVVVPGDALGMLEDLGREGVLLLRNVAEFLDKRQVAVGFNVALSAGIPVPIPGAAEVAALLDDAQVLDAGFPQTRARQ